jgi:hypothetical protein
MSRGAPRDGAVLLQTPLGALTFVAVADGVELTGPPLLRWRLGESRYLERWESRIAEVERLACRIDPALPAAMAVDECWAVLWRFVVVGEIRRFAASGRLVRRQHLSKASPEGGEHLHAVEFEGAGWRLHIGTEDDEALSLSAARAVDACVTPDSK